MALPGFVRSWVGVDNGDGLEHTQPQEKKTNENKTIPSDIHPGTVYDEMIHRNPTIDRLFEWSQFRRSDRGIGGKGSPRYPLLC